VARSDWRCTIEADNSVRLGFCVVRGLRNEHAQQMLEHRAQAPFESMEDFQARVPLNKDELRTLAEIGALNCLAAHRRDALWQVEKPVHTDELFAKKTIASLTENTDGAGPVFLDSLFDFGRRQKLLTTNAGQGQSEPVSNPARSGALPHHSTSPLFPMNPMERLRADFNGMDLTTGPHPMALIRSQLENVWRASDLPKGRHGQHVRIAGNVICRQRPGTAKGFVFISLEDETGVSNAIVNPKLFEAKRLVITQEPFLIIEGRLQNIDNVVTVKARHIVGLRYTDLVGSASHDFH
jgi:error-prone DNA polymerase